MVRIVSDTVDGVHGICDPWEGSLRDLSMMVEVWSSQPYIRSIHIYLPEEAGNARE